MSTVACHEPHCQYQEQQCAAQLPNKLRQILIIYVSIPSLYANIGSMSIGAGLYMYDVVLKTSRLLSHLPMSVFPVLQTVVNK